MDRLDSLSLNLEKNNIDKIKELFPEAVEEEKINFDMLRAMLGDEVDDSKEKYQFTWNGKAKSIKLAQTPSSATLRPCKEKSKNWDTTENMYIEGDNLEVLKQLQKTYYGKIKMIYIDPPYNTGNDFVYNDSFSNTLENYKEQTNQSSSSNPESTGRFHTNWLNMIYPRLLLSRNLLSDDGVIFISIDDNEIDNLRKICDEIFGESSYVDCIVWNKRIPKNDNKGIGNIHEYILVYEKNSNTNRLYTIRKDGLDDIYNLLKDFKRKHLPIPDAEKQLQQFYNKKGYDRGITLYNNLDNNYEPWGKINVSWPNANTFGPRYDVIHPRSNKPTKVPDRGWRWKQESFNEKLDYKNCYERYDGSYICGDIWFAKDENTQPSLIKYLKDVDKMLLRSIISLKSDGGFDIEKLFDGKSYFSYPKPISLIKTILASLNEKEGIVLDFFSGSSTTAHAIMKLNAEDGGNRKFIMVQLPELCDEKSEAYKAGYKNICEIGEERIRRAGEQIKAEWEKEHPSDGLFGSDEEFTTDIGFKVFKLDSTNVNEWDSNMKLDEKELTMRLAEVFKGDRSKEDILYEIMLKYGVFDKQVEEINVNGKTMYRVGKRYMIVCLDNQITSEDVKAIGELSPKTVIFNEAGFRDDNEKINATYNLKQCGVEDIKCI